MTDKNEDKPLLWGDEQVSFEKETPYITDDNINHVTSSDTPGVSAKENAVFIHDAVIKELKGTRVYGVFIAVLMLLCAYLTFIEVLSIRPLEQAFWAYENVFLVIAFMMGFWLVFTPKKDVKMKMRVIECREKLIGEEGVPELFDLTRTSLEAAMKLLKWRLIWSVVGSLSLLAWTQITFLNLGYEMTLSYINSFGETPYYSGSLALLTVAVTLVMLVLVSYFKIEFESYHFLVEPQEREEE